MHYNIHFISREIEQMAGLDDLKSFVHQRGGIDGDSISHLPGRVIEGLFGCDVCQLTGRSCAEWAA